MKKIMKQVAAIDVAQDELVVCLGRLDESLNKELFAHMTFGNDLKGFASLAAWVKKLSVAGLAVRSVM